MRCPFCGVEDTQVKDSRPAEDGAAIRRRRACASCGARFTTFERVQLREITVLKTDGRRVPFDREKLARSVRVALRKRPVDEDRIERLVNSIQRRLETEGETEIPSRKISYPARYHCANEDAVYIGSGADSARNGDGLDDLAGEPEAR